jgi:rhamnose transport system permease protein
MNQATSKKVTTRSKLIKGSMLVALIVAIKLFIPRLFEFESINSVLLWLPLLLMVALGELVVVLTGGIDISVGSILACSAMLLGIWVSQHPDTSLAAMFGLCALTGLILGGINGALVGLAKLPPLIVTIGTLATFRGLAFLIGSGKTVTGSMLPDSLLSLASHGLTLGNILISWLTIISLLAAAALSLFLKFSILGREIYAFGSQPLRAFRSGISERKIQFMVFMISGACAGIGGWIYASRFGLVHPGTAGSGFELSVIAAVVVGGTKLTGGQGSVLKVVLSCILLSLINVGLSVVGIDASWQMLVYGLVLLFAVMLGGKPLFKLENLLKKEERA